jgi:hypothetical protein
MSEVIASVDWLRVAEPQADCYDSTVVLSLLEAEVAGAFKQEIGLPTFADGTISLTQDPILNGFGGCRSAPLDHPNVITAERLLRLWPEGFKQCQLLLCSIGLSESDELGSDQVVGSICGPGSYGFGSIAVTVNHHMGLAEGIVHEMAHHKLRALGVEFESAKRIVANSTQDRFRSPIRYDCLRPMTAVLHAQYSYTYIANLDLAVITRDLSDQMRRLAVLKDSLAVIIPKLEFGMEVLRDNWEYDEEGKLFAEGLFCWCERIISDGRRLLKEFGIPPQPFAHPLH